jgi:hypothetical protein
MNQLAAANPALQQRNCRGAGEDRFRNVFEDAPYGVRRTTP